LLGCALFLAEAEAEEGDGDEIEGYEGEIEGAEPLGVDDEGKSGEGDRQTCLRRAFWAVCAVGCAEGQCRL